jgi:hypothetical protein
MIPTIKCMKCLEWCDINYTKDWDKGDCEIKCNYCYKNDGKQKEDENN